MSVAARLTCPKSKPSSGSISKTMRSGRSGVCLSDPQTWNSKVFICTPPISPARSSIHRMRLSVPLILVSWPDLSDFGIPGNACFWKNVFGQVIVGIAHQGQRPVFQVRQHAVDDGSVIGHQVRLGDLGARIHDLIRMGELDAQRTRDLDADRRIQIVTGILDRDLEDDLGGSLIGSHTLERGVPQRSVRGYLGIGDFSHQLGPDPLRLAGDVLRDSGEGRLADPHRFHLLQNLGAHRIAEAGAHAPAVNELALLVGAEDEARHAAPVAGAPAADDEFLALGALDLQPAFRTVPDVATVRGLGDDALMAAGAHGVEHRFAVVDDVEYCRLSPGSRSPISVSRLALRLISGSALRSSPSCSKMSKA
jgi:hypothetical protein